MARNVFALALLMALALSGCSKLDMLDKVPFLGNKKAKAADFAAQYLKFKAVSKAVKAAPKAVWVALAGPRVPPLDLLHRAAAEPLHRPRCRAREQARRDSQKESAGLSTGAPSFLLADLSAVDVDVADVAAIVDVALEAQLGRLLRGIAAVAAIAAIAVARGRHGRAVGAVAAGPAVADLDPAPAVAAAIIAPRIIVAAAISTLGAAISTLAPSISTTPSREVLPSTSTELRSEVAG
mgnify:CR=1 FL=1